MPQNYESCLAFLREKNTGVSKLTGQSFGELIDEFIWFGDETGFQACDGALKIIGGKALPKHERRTADSRASVSFYRVGNAKGQDGPTGFMPPGKYRKAAFTDAFLEEQGAPPGSTLVMTPNGYMAEEAWETISPSTARGIRALIDKHNPEWWALKMVGGYTPHTTSLNAMKAHEAKKVLLCCSRRRPSRAT